MSQELNFVFFLPHIYPFTRKAQKRLLAAADCKVSCHKILLTFQRSRTFGGNHYPFSCPTLQKQSHFSKVT